MKVGKNMVFISVHQLNRLLTTGELLAATVTNYADDLDMSSGNNPHRTERTLAQSWDNEAMTVKRIINEIAPQHAVPADVQQVS